MKIFLYLSHELTQNVKLLCLHKQKESNLNIKYEYKMVIDLFDSITETVRKCKNELMQHPYISMVFIKIWADNAIAYLILQSY
jgi:hypothetical protein